MSVKNIVSQFVMVALCLLSLAIGTDGFNLTGLNSLIFWQSRFPRTLSIVLVGSSMSLAGLLMQSISNNKFAGPSTVGTIEAAKLGLILCLITPGITNGNKIFFSFLSAAVFTLGFITLLRQIHIKKDWMVPLFGIIYGQLLNGLGQAIAYRYQLTQNIQSWVQGSFAMIQVGRYEWLFLNIITIFISYLLIHRLSIVKLGEDFSTNLGINYQATWFIIIMCVSLTTAVNVMVVGTLPFIGVIIPNILRIQSGDLLAHSMSAVMIYGASFVLLCDILARMIIMPFEIPVGVIISLIGSGIFIYILIVKEG